MVSNHFFFMQGFKNTYFILNFSTIRIRSEKSYFLVLSCSFILMLPSPIWILGLLHVSQLLVDGYV